MTTLPIVGIDIRLIGKQRTGDEIVFFNLTRALLQYQGRFRFRLFTDETDREILRSLQTALGCAGREDVELVSLKWGKNRFLWNGWVLPWELFRRPVALYHTQYIAPLWLPQYVRLVLHIHDVSFAAHPEWIGWKDRLFLKLFIPRSLGRAVKIVVPSHFTQTETVKYFPATQGKISVIPNAAAQEWGEPISQTSIKSVREIYHLPERYIIASGTMQPRKNIPLLIRAWAERPAELTDVGLVLTGNRFGHHVDTQLYDPALTEKIIFAGYVDVATLRTFIAGAQVSALPSLYEGFGIPLLEAFAVGTPAVASHILPFQEVGGGAFLSFDPTNLADLKKNLYSLFVDSSLRERLIHAGRERCAAFTWKRSAAMLLQEYEAIVS